MSTKFKTIITTAGAAKLAAATMPGGKKVNLTAMAVGDGGGALSEPNAGQVKLINEVWRHALNKISQTTKIKTISWRSWSFLQRWAASGCVSWVCMMTQAR